MITVEHIWSAIWQPHNLSQVSGETPHRAKGSNRKCCSWFPWKFCQNSIYLSIAATNCSFFEKISSLVYSLHFCLVIMGEVVRVTPMRWWEMYNHVQSFWISNIWSSREITWHPTKTWYPWGTWYPHNITIIIYLQYLRLQLYMYNKTIRYVLVVFSLLAMFQCTIWNTWGPVEKVFVTSSLHDH